MSSSRHTSTVPSPRKAGTPTKQRPASAKETALDAMRGLDSPSVIRSHAFASLPRMDISPAEPLDGEKPNELLQRLYEMWPDQLTASYRPHVPISPNSTAEANLRYLRELYPSKLRRNLPKVRAAGVVVETVCHLGKKGVFLRPSGGEPLSLAAAAVESKSRLCL